MRWLLPVVVSVLIVLLYVTPQGAHLRSFIVPAEQAADGRPADNQSDTDDDDDDHPSRLRMQDGVLGIELTPETQAISGIQVHPAEAMQYRQEMQALAEVVSIEPLLKLRTGSDRLRAEIRITEVELQRSREAYERLSLLHEDNANISTRQLEEARAQMQADLARLAAQKQQLRSLHDEAIQAWGEILAEWALNADGDGLFQQLLKRHEVLLNLTLGRNQSLPETSRVIFINRNDNRINARKAYLISPAPRTEPSLQGETYFFHARADRLRVGMRLRAWIPISGEVIEGVYAPADAVIWQAGKPWVYFHNGDDFFYRRALDSPSRLSDDWFIPSPQVREGELIVTTGAQMLLSEEYRWQIPDEDDDP